jgi:hypothetical protein
MKHTERSQCIHLTGMSFPSLTFIHMQHHSVTTQMLKGLFSGGWRYVVSPCLEIHWKRQLHNPQPQCNQEKQHLYYIILPYITIDYHILLYITICYHILPYISYICRQSQSPTTKSHRFLRVPSVSTLFRAHPPDINGSTAVAPAFSSASWPDQQQRQVDPGGQDFSKNSRSDFFHVPNTEEWTWFCFKHHYIHEEKCQSYSGKGHVWQMWQVLIREVRDLSYQTRPNNFVTW